MELSYIVVIPNKNAPVQTQQTKPSLLFLMNATEVPDNLRSLLKNPLAELIRKG